MKRIATILARLSLRGYSLFLLFLLWLMWLSTNASGGVATPMYGVIAMYGPAQPEYGVVAPYGCYATPVHKNAEPTVADYKHGV
jgi:hypothetical protein